MSYDFSLKIPACEHCGSTERSVHSWSGMTGNLAPMWRLAGLSPGDMDGESAADAAPKLRAVIEKMETDPGAYRALNPANGWGNFDEMLPYMKDLLAAMVAHPRAVVRVSW